MMMFHQPLNAPKIFGFMALVVSTFAAPHAVLADSCGIRSEGVSGVSLGDYNPLLGRALSKDLSFNLLGPANSRAWVRVKINHDQGMLATEFFGLTNSGLARIDGGDSQALVTDVGTLNAQWLAVGFDAQGRSTVRIRAEVPETVYSRAGNVSQTINLAVACAMDNLVQVDDFPLTVASLQVRVVSAISVTEASSNVLRFGTLPESNEEGFSPASAKAFISVASTGGFDVKLSSADWFLRNVTPAGGRGRDAISFTTSVSTQTGVSLNQTNQSLRCDASADRQGSQSLTISAQLPANAAQGKMAGLYRGNVSVEISPLELSSLSQTSGCSVS